LSPDCGRAPGSFDTLITMAGRAATAGSTMGMPVRGMTGVGATVVVVDDDVDVDDEEEVDEVDDDVDDDEVVAAGCVGIGGSTATTLLAGAAELLLQATSPSVAISSVDVLASLTVLSVVQCALRAEGGYRTCG
jgi:hypothetical protein